MSLVQIQHRPPLTTPSLRRANGMGLPSVTLSYTDKLEVRKGIMMRLRLTAVCATLAVSMALLPVAGCGGSGSAPPALNGTSWRLTGWTLSSLDPNGFTITAAFADGKISGKSAVNTYSGSYTEGPGDAFSVGELASTMMAGPEPDMRAEQAYLTLLSQAKSYALKGGGLTLFDENGNESLIFAAK
jgi:heat shock protein HslJ